MKRILYIFIFLFGTQSTGFTQIIAGFSTDTTFYCLGDSVQFTDTSKGINSQVITNWMWVFGDGDTVDIQNPLHAFMSPGTYTVKLTASNTNWNASASKTIVVRNLPEADFTYTGRIDKPFFMLIFYGNVVNADAWNYSYSWAFPGDSTTFTNKDTAFYTFPLQGLHTVSFTVEAGKNCSDTVTKTIEVKDSLEVPNVFSPNGDNINDIFEFRTNGITVYELTVYNRWGVVIYLITAKRPFWDGISSAGVKMAPGNYFYVLKAQDESGYEKHGIIVLR